MAFKLIVFDLDGTLADTGQDLADCVNTLRRRLGFKRLADRAIAAHVGQGVAHLLRHTIPAGVGAAMAVDALYRNHPDHYRLFHAIYVRGCTRKTRLYPGFKAVLQGLRRGVILAVATNKPGGLSRKILRKLGVLGRFRAVIGGDEMRIRKPHPAVLLDLMKKFRVKRSETIMVGDSRFDLETAHRARVRAVACTWGFGSRTELRRWRPAFTIPRPRSLSRILADG